MKYDDASWHYGGDFPSDLPHEAGATHIGMFVAWALLNGIGGEIHLEDNPEALEKLRQRTIKPGQYFISQCDEKFTDEDLSERGNAFAKAYYLARDPKPNYFEDYGATLGESNRSLYYIADTWENYDRVSAIIQKRWEELAAKQ